MKEETLFADWKMQLKTIEPLATRQLHRSDSQSIAIS